MRLWRFSATLQQCTHRGIVLYLFIYFFFLPLAHDHERRRSELHELHKCYLFTYSARGANSEGGSLGQLSLHLRDARRTGFEAQLAFQGRKLKGPKTRTRVWSDVKLQQRATKDKYSRTKLILHSENLAGT